MPALRLVLGDQLSADLSSLSDWDDGDGLLMAEVDDEATYVRHHPKKIAFLFSAMRHFAEAQEKAGRPVRYVRIDDPETSGSLAGEVGRALADGDYDRLVVTECGEYRLAQEMAAWSDRFDIPVDIRPDTRFICGIDAFKDWAEGRKSLLMETFYRRMREKTGLLLDEGGKPEGGSWNYDAENRKSLPDEISPPKVMGFTPDKITEDVLKTVGERYGDHFGDLHPFSFAVTPGEAKRAFSHFIRHALPDFGDYQDAMKEGEPDLFHAHIGVYLNAGLLDPLEVCQQAEEAYRDGHAPLNAVEGFIRQIIGWREYVRGIYWLHMPNYKKRNTLGAVRPLPDFYWTGETEMNCLRQAIKETKANAYAHHIQRLMVTGNFALLAGVKPDDINAWYLIVYADAYEWVQLPNTHGMAIFADGGIMATKPYAAGGAYINRMSDYCKNCSYKVSKKTGKGACPFNYLYWDFLIRNKDKLKDNRRLAMPYRTLAKFDDKKLSDIRDSAKAFFDALDGGGEAPGERLL